MRKLIYWIIIIGSTLLLVLLLNHSLIKENSYEKIGVNYLEATGYEVIEYKGTTEKYVLSSDKLTNFPTSYIGQWSVQQNNLLEYIDKEISVEQFIVKGHPLDNWSSGFLSSVGKTEIRLFFVDNKVVGGISAPVVEGNPRYVSGVHSIDGRMFNEIHSIPFEEWRKNLIKEIRK